MRVPGHFYVNDKLKHLVFEELQMFCQRGDVGGFLPAVKQLCNVAGLPGIVQVGCARSSDSVQSIDRRHDGIIKSST